MKKWASIPTEFNDWWNQEYKDSTNPFALDSAAYWAWAGWSAAKQQPATHVEPVAYMYWNPVWDRYDIGNGDEPVRDLRFGRFTEQDKKAYEGQGYKFEPLYTSPQPTPELVQAARQAPKKEQA